MATQYQSFPRSNYAQVSDASQAHPISSRIMQAHYDRQYDRHLPCPFESCNERREAADMVHHLRVRHGLR